MYFQKSQSYLVALGYALTLINTTLAAKIDLRNHKYVIKPKVFLIDMVSCSFGACVC